MNAVMSATYDGVSTVVRAQLACHLTLTLSSCCCCCISSLGALSSHLFTTLGAPHEARMASAAAGQAMSLVRRSLDESAALAAGLLKAFEREVADTQLLMVPQVSPAAASAVG